MVEPQDRPMLTDLAALNRPHGLECRGCGCRDWRVVKTRQGDGMVLRRRECRNCGKRITTFEQP